VIRSPDGVLTVYPPQRLEFDASDIPASVANALHEAITCHANECCIAAAIMVRKCLEELCHNRGAKGQNLQKRIAALKTAVMLPLLAAMDDLRLLGNDAAHIESQTFAQVSREEVEIGIQLAKELLKGVYQYDVLLQRMQGLKQAQNP
jgi:hypothetical protein